ncbi:hypothetical protein [Actinokineospora sp. NBRC 105648]|uniref:hypothetical protein n=1 Tax=Actinokineospora sp. NBRC 105648 TaxID=3032206 RepID=UPI0024A0B31E|nr:hypothetical protein [Actinokineospora sp. NBRC 105648]GLZ38062.1 hypothetical protein Acsp05_16860 [Actinokineospora sp. NBRC 105648]
MTGSVHDLTRRVAAGSCCAPVGCGSHGITRLTPDHRGAVVMDIWRIQDGLLAEHWDVGQQVPDDISPDDML